MINTDEEYIRLIKRLQHKEQCSNSLLLAIPDMIFLMDIEGRYLDFKGGNGAVFIPAQTIIGSNIKDSGMPQQVIDDILLQVTKTIELNEIVEIQYVLTINEMTHYYESRSARYDDTKAIRIVREVTDKALYLEAIQKKNKKLEQYAKITSHELRRPLANILSLSIILQEDSNERQQEALGRLLTSAKELDLIIHKLNQLVQSKSLD
jgi:hypothetical protein